ncbi:unnamed protein product [Rotaria magnacalcarata]|uniref:Uncharacterized protein n=1 Tax=Rotaria magnacalcarata TaxID=392030 RepID=A0A816R6M1_9BILA|nr:unnamed protein product [Rotaria magnacalcarata]CAF1585345.1 unnamed protein product [Rotaria magnacalcarata]CAF2057167.1 unnamed protein product [Rotaria magnacalcarata]CAF2068824.1 unnamed protein product [Rotaria magnacalcarata]CAF2165538.1 unnamed protein product [Rotaria magnacalcarata]
MLYLTLLTILFVFNGAHSLDCRIVKQGQHFTSTLPFYGFKNESVISVRIQFTESTAHYLFPPTESNGRSCSQSWNAVWGSTRCGYLNSQLMDSDRFVWRRVGSCLQYDSQGFVISERVDCAEADLVELAASAYDNGLKPYQFSGILLKEFSAKLRINTWYKLQLTFEETKTVYQLSDDASQVLEVQTVQHRSCPKFSSGAYQGLYFGGQCPAPQDVSVCYD